MKIFIHSIRPDLFLIGFNIGTGRVTAKSKTGINYGRLLRLMLNRDEYI
ncbi:MAG: hypothetical protein K9G41_08960 [Flavobacteriales bacterium]|nr:hypothetical protein [Flavobacteriales bacterium]